MSNAIVFDTDILIDAGRGIKEALDCLQQYEHQTILAISIVTKMELVVGCTDKRELRYSVFAFNALPRYSVNILIINELNNIDCTVLNRETLYFTERKNLVFRHKNIYLEYDIS